MDNFEWGQGYTYVQKEGYISFGTYSLKVVITGKSSAFTLSTSLIQHYQGQPKNHLSFLLSSLSTTDLLKKICHKQSPKIHYQTIMQFHHTAVIL